MEVPTMHPWFVEASTRLKSTATRSWVTVRHLNRWVPEKVATRLRRGMEGRAGAFCKCMNLLFSFFPIGPLAGWVRAIWGWKKGEACCLPWACPTCLFWGPHRNIFPTLSRDGAPINAEATVETNIAYYQLFANDVHALLPSVSKAVHVRFSSLLRHNLVILFLLLFNLKLLFHGWLFTEKLSAFDLFLVPSVESQHHPYTVAAMHAYDMLTIYVIHTLLLQCIHCILYNYTVRDIGIQTM